MPSISRRAPDVRAVLFTTVAVALAFTGCSSRTNQGSVAPVGEEPGATEPGDDADGGAADSADGGSNVGAPCSTHTECVASVCSRTDGRCVRCRTTADCARGERCAGTQCVASTACTSDRSCASSNMVCDGEGERCVECNTADDCAGMPCLGHSCVATRACTSSTQCADLNMVCGPALPPAWPATYLGKGCGECTTVADCGAGEACLERMCVPVCREAKRTCGSFEGAVCGSCPSGSACVSTGRGCARGRADAYGATASADGGDRLFLERDGRASGGASLSEILDGSAPPRLVATSPVYLDGVAVNATHVFFADVGGAIHRRGIQSGSVGVFARVPPSTSSWCQGIAATDAYLVCSVVDYANGANSGIYAYPTGGGPGTRISPVVQASILAEGSHVYWAEINGPQIGRTPLAGGPTQLLGRRQGKVRGIVGGHLYVETYSAGLIRIPTGGGAEQRVSADHTFLGGGGSVIYTAGSDGIVYASDLDGKNATPLGTSAELGGAPVHAAYRRGNDILFVGANDVVLLKP